MPMRLIEVRKAVYYSLTDNRITDTTDAKRCAKQLGDHPGTVVECCGYRFWVSNT